MGTTSCATVASTVRAALSASADTSTGVVISDITAPFYQPYGRRVRQLDLHRSSDSPDDGHTIIDAGYSTTWQNVVKASAIAIGAVAAPEVVQGFSAALRAASVRVAIERQLRTDPEAGPSDLSNFGHSFRDAYNAVGPGATQWQKIQAAYLVAAEPFFSPVVRATIRVAMANMIRTVLRRGG